MQSISLSELYSPILSFVLIAEALITKEVAAIICFFLEKWLCGAAQLYVVG